MTIVHDLRNPLAAIHSGAELLNRSHLTEPDVRRLARNMYEASVRIQEMLQGYVDLFRTKASHPHRSNLRALVAHAVERIATAAERQSVTVVHDVPADLVVTVDRRRIGSAIANLLANALEAMPRGGSIRISAETAPDCVVVKVRDSGPGVPPEIRDRLFEPFVTARKPNGWGLGLAHAREALTDHGGDLWLECASGAGACFAFKLPTIG